MGQRTYLIQLYWLAYALSKYIGRWLPKMIPGMSPEQATCVNSLLVALQDCLVLFAPPPPNN